MTKVEILEFSDKDDLIALSGEWRALYAESEGSPFLSWEWISTWFEHFCIGKTACIVKVIRGDKLIAILPMFWDSSSFWEKEKSRMRLIGDGPGGADHLDVISRLEDRELAYAAIMEFLRKIPGLVTVRLGNVAADSPALRQRKSFDSFSCSTAATCPQIDLSDGWDAVLASIKRASTFKRRRNQIRKMDGFEYRSITDPAETGPAFERFLSLHQRRWDKAGGSELSGHPRLVEFQRDVVRRMSEAGLVRFEELWLEGECRSSIYGLDDGVTFRYYNSGYDLDYAHRSVGFVLLGLSVENACERGVRLYDFLRGDENYKFEWSNRSQETYNVTVSRKSIAIAASRQVGAFVTGMKKLGKSALPAGITVSLANKRRAWKRSLQFLGQ